MKRLLIVIAALLTGTTAFAEEGVIRIASKQFTESYVLAEIAAQVVERVGEAKVDRRFGMGGTGMVAAALEGGSIDLYPEYSGTIAEAILKEPGLRSLRVMSGPLARRGLVASGPLGFNNTYALAVRRDHAGAGKLSKISDLKRDPEIRAGLSHEFMERPDGYPGLARHYKFKLEHIQSISHSLAYDALASGSIDLTDIYSTDARIASLDLLILEDDLRFFPDYSAVWLAREDVRKRYPKTWAALRALEGKIDARAMIELNGKADLERQSFSEIASGFLSRHLSAPSQAVGQRDGMLARLRARTTEHLTMVLVSVGLAIALGIPLGIAATRFPLFRKPILFVSGVLQTIPSLALLCFLIPLLGIGAVPALVAILLYSLLPIIANTHSGLASIDPKLLESAQALGLTPAQRLSRIELPLASPAILTGVRTSAVISIGTATLAALIGAGGYGAPIVTGLALNDMGLILEGAIPAASLSLLAQVAFEALEHALIPRSLRRMRGTTQP